MLIHIINLLNLINKWLQNLDGVNRSGDFRNVRDQSFGYKVFQIMISAQFHSFDFTYCRFCLMKSRLTSSS